MNPPVQDRRPRAGPRCSAALLLALIAGAPVARAQQDLPQPGQVEALEGHAIRRLILRSPIPDSDPPEYQPLPPELEQISRNHIHSVEGTPFSAERVSDDIALLNQLGRFSRVESGVRQLPGGGVEVVFSLTPVPIIADVQVPSDTRVSARDIAEVVDLLVGTPVDRFELDRAARAIEDLYRAKGYPDVNVTWDQDELDRTGVAFFKITEGARVKVTDIRFEFVDQQAFPESRLRDKIKTNTAGLFTRGTLKEDQLADDVAAILQFYRDEGYIDARVDRLPPRISPNGREAIITFVIEQGPRYTLRSVQIDYPESPHRQFTSRELALADAAPGEEVSLTGPGQYAVFRPEPFSTAQIAGLMSLKPGQVYSQAGIDDSLKSIEAAFGELGYADVKFDSPSLRKVELRDPDAPGQVDLIILIRPGEPSRVGMILIDGNEITKHNVIRRQLEIRPDRPTSAADIARSELALRRSRYFELEPTAPERQPRITVLPVDPSFPTYRDVLVEVTETSTGEFNLGGAFSSDGGLTARVSYTQRNFDIADPPDTLAELISNRAFRGAGQIFSIDVLPGTSVQQYSVGLTDPAIFDSPYSAGVLLSYRDRIFREFDEARATARLTVGRRFGSRWTGSTSLRVESIDISDIEPDSAVDLFAVEGQNALTALGVQLSRSSLDHPIFPSRGSRIRLAADQFGILGGDFTFTRLRAEGGVVLTLYEDLLDHRTTLEINTEIGYIPQGPEEAPLFERLYRGGRSFRGLDFRTVSPKGIRNDTGEVGDDPVGGTWEFFLGAEITQPIYEDIFALALFVDSGTVTDDIGLDEYRVTAGAGIRLVTPLSPAPLALDFGFPIMKEDGDRNRLFTFSIDIPLR